MAAVANYAKHHGEVGGGAGSVPGEVFLKAPSSLVGSGGTVVLPNAPGRDIHHEAELAVVIGRRGRDIVAADAYQHVFGYTCLLDLSARGKGDRSRRKSYDGFTPMGPWVVTADEVADPQQLTITLSVNDEQRQRGSTADMTYSIAEIIAYASRVMTLEPGDVIATGTPEGCGPGRRRRHGPARDREHRRPVGDGRRALAGRRAPGPVAAGPVLKARRGAVGPVMPSR